MLTQGLLDYFSTLPPISNIFSNFSSSALKRHLLKRHLTLSKILPVRCRENGHLEANPLKLAVFPCVAGEKLHV